MSLVAYDASSDDESDYEDDKASKVIVIKKTSEEMSPQFPQSRDIFSNGHISDDDEFVTQVETKANDSVSSLSKFLPKPKNYANLSEVLENFDKPIFSVLPIPKPIETKVDIEEDDEFLHKKPKEEIIEKPNNTIEVKKLPVKIIIPSLKNFQDVEKEIEDKAKNKLVVSNATFSGSSGLLSMLPKAKSERNFAIASTTLNENNKPTTATVKPTIPCFVPDTVKQRRPATSTEDIDRHKLTKKKLNTEANKSSVQINKKADSEESDDESTCIGDFFSLKSDYTLPDVSATEINALVAKKAAKIIETTTNYLKSKEIQNGNKVEEVEIDTHEMEASRKRYNQERHLNSEALEALVGGSNKRRRQQQSDINVIDINSSQVLPNKEEWMRTALASATSYQPTGVLVDEEPASGTRRKHQITYLAHKAKANEAELQAMWSANRQNRRATQSKYGF